MRRFNLVRDEDVSGVSGTGIVAEGVEFGDETVAIRWCVGPARSTVIWDDINDAELVHGHEGRTRIEWLDRWERQ